MAKEDRKEAERRKRRREVAQEFYRSEIRWGLIGLALILVAYVGYRIFS